MRKQILFFLTMVLASCLGLHAQDKKQTTGTNTSTKKEMNLLDEQAKLFGNLFGDTDKDINGNKDPFKGVTNYEELLNKSQLAPETKNQFWSMYQLYDKSLVPQEKDSLKMIMEKFLAKEMETQQKRPQNR